MVISIAIDAVAANDTIRKFKFFRKGVEKEFTDTQKTNMLGNEIVRIARTLAPRFTGKLADSLRYEIREPGKITIISGTRYGFFQEFGYAPHYVSLGIPEVKEWFEAHATGESTGRGRRGYIFVSKFTPHIRPAIEELRPKVSKLLYETIYEYMRKTFGIWRY